MDTWQSGPSGISVEQAVRMQLAGSLARSYSLLSKGALASLRMQKRVQQFINNPSHVLASSMAWKDLWREAWAIAQHSRIASSLPRCEPLWGWEWMCDVLRTSVSFLMCWSWQRVAVIWGLKAKCSCCIILWEGEQCCSVSLWLAGIGEELYPSSSLDLSWVKFSTWNAESPEKGMS